MKAFPQVSCWTALEVLENTVSDRCWIAVDQVSHWCAVAVLPANRAGFNRIHSECVSAVKVLTSLQAFCQGDFQITDAGVAHHRKIMPNCSSSRLRASADPAWVEM